MIHQMQKICRPCVQQNGGIVAKADADNLFCLFDQVRDAVYASREIINRLEVVNMVLPVEKQLYVAFGIGFGSILNLANEDIFGDEMNLACKLGEDIAGKGEILLTSAAKAELAQSAQSDGSEIATREEVISISGISLVFFCVLLFSTRIIVEANPIWRAASWAMGIELVLITLAVIYLVGGKSWLKHFAFPVIFLLIALPWPSHWENGLVQALMRANTQVVVEIISVSWA